MIKVLVFFIFLSVFVFSKEASSGKTTGASSSSSKVSSADSVGRWGRGAKDSPSFLRGYYIGVALAPVLDGVNSNKKTNLNGQNGNDLLDNNSAGYFLIGRNINSWFAMEVSFSSGFQYVDTDTTPYTPTSKASYTSTRTEDKQNFQSYYLDAVFRRTLMKQSEGFLKFGLGYNVFTNKQTQDITTITGGGGTIIDNDYSSNRAVFKDLGTHLALGYQYNFNKNKSLGLSYNFYTTFGRDYSYKLNPSSNNTIESKLRIFYSTLMLEYSYHF